MPVSTTLSDESRYGSSVDEHARRITQPSSDAPADYLAGRVSVLELSRLTEQAVGVSDGASAPALRLLNTVANDLGCAAYASDQEALSVTNQTACNRLTQVPRTGQRCTLGTVKRGGYS